MATASPLDTGTSEPPVRFWGVTDLPALEFDPLLDDLLVNEPVARIRLPNGEGTAWLVTRHEDVAFVTSDARFSRQALVDTPVTRLAPHRIPTSEAVGFADPPEHTRLRRTVSKAFTTRRAEQLRPRIRQIAEQLLDAVEADGPPADLVGRYTGPLALDVISEVMGVPPEDRPRMGELANVLISMAYGREASEQAKEEAAAYFSGLARRRAEEPRDDVLSSLAGAERRGELSHGELVGLVVLVQTSAAHAVRNNSANMIYALLTHPEQLAALRADRSLLPQAVEELLRYVPHRNGVGQCRIATEDVQVGGVTIRAGEAVYASYLAANRDSSVFPEPGRLDIGRGTVPHMAFGHGPHYCLGASLARVECEVILSCLLDRFPGLRLAVPPGEVPWRRKALIRGPESLPVAW
ncbi:cytochrome P450 [Streptomyces capparidis]